MNGGFGDADHLARLYDEGYDFVARAHSHAVADGLRREDGLIWEKVSTNGVIAESQRTTVGTCSYPRRLFARRHLPTRHQCGIALDQDLVLLALNLIR